MSTISEIDKNFKVETKLNKEDIVFYDTKKNRLEFTVYFSRTGVTEECPEM